jgi:hypothetical protein
MNKLILCEGATDAILLSYYLGRTAGWKFCRKPPKNLTIKEDGIEESINWYEKGDDRLLICGAGGKDRIKPFFERKIKPAITNVDAFEKIALLLDRDDRETDSIERHASMILRPVITKAKSNKWIINTYRNAFDQEKQIDMLLVAIPVEHQGALETVLLDAISEDPYDAHIVELVIQFVKTMRVEAGKYITSDRKELKARLGVTWAVQYPEKVFKLINEQIQSVPWEESEVLKKCFEELIKI